MEDPEKNKSVLMKKLVLLYLEKSIKTFAHS